MSVIRRHAPIYTHVHAISLTFENDKCVLSRLTLELFHEIRQATWQHPAVDTGRGLTCRAYYTTSTVICFDYNESMLQNFSNICNVQILTQISVAANTDHKLKT